MDTLFIGGCGRSGTTLLGSMLGSHTRCVATPESRFIPAVYRRLLQAGETVDADHAWRRLRDHWGVRVWEVDGGPPPVPPGASYAELIEALVERFADRSGQSAADTWVDHTPGNVTHAPTLVDLFPAARFIHLVRDGRAVAASVLPLDWGPNTVDSASQWWMTRVTRGVAAETFFGPSRSLRVHYEDLVLDPEGTLRSICDFLGFQFEPAMLTGSDFSVPQYTRDQHELVGRGPDSSRLEAWARELTPRQVEVFESRAWQLLNAFGYELVNDGKVAPLSTTEKIASVAAEAMWKRVNRFRHRRRRDSVGSDS